MNATFRPPIREGHSALLTLLRLLLTGIMLFVSFLAVRDLYGAMTMRYEVTGADLVIHYGFETKQIPLEQIQQTWLLEEPTGAVRQFGTSTIGLKAGRWSTRETGPLELYATQLNDLLIIETASGTVGITPAESEALQQAIATGGTTTALPAGSRNHTVSAMLVQLGVLAAIIWLGLAVLGYTARFPRRLHYELASDRLTILTGWRPVTIWLDEIERVDLAEPKGYPLRLWGAAMPGILWGRFVWRQAGPRVSLYATQARPIVLLHLQGERTVGITPTDAAGFVQALESVWGGTR